MPKLISLRKSRLVLLLLAVVALFATACSSDSGSPGKTVTKTGSAPAAPGSSAEGSSTSATPTAPPKTSVRITTINSDGVTYGVGMPVIVYFSKRIKDAKAFQAATKTTADGQPLETAWYFQNSNAGKGPIEAQLRPKEYWPANKSIKVTFPPAGTSLGGNDVSDGKLTSLDFKIGDRKIVTVDNSSHRLTVTVNGRKEGSYPVSLGATNTPTQRGIKVIMEKGRSICMSGPGYNECGVKDTQRLTFGGEYLHAAPWNVSNINNGRNSSNGCTNLLNSDAKALYGELTVGDVVTYPNANGPQMQMGQGYGLWNVPWGEYQSGGLVATR